jgi:hypothetical protein
MSTKLVEEAKLLFYDGPVTDYKVRGAIAALSKALQNGTYGDSVLDRAGRGIPGYSDMEFDAKIMTSDGYRWRHSLSFTVASGRFVILIPCTRDKERSGGYSFDRSIAVYTAGRIPAAKIVEAVDKFIPQFKVASDEFEKMLKNTNRPYYIDP